MRNSKYYPENMTYEEFSAAINGPIYSLEDQNGKYTGKILKYEKPDYTMLEVFEYGFICVFHKLSQDDLTKVKVADYCFFDEFNKTWSIDENILKERISPNG